MAWLHATPKADKKRALASSTPVEEPMSRIAKLKAEGMEPAIPPVSAEYLVEHLFDVGPTMPGGMGATPITFGEIAAWQSCVAVSLRSWEVRALRRLSVSYLAQLHDSEKEDCPAPFTDPLNENRNKVAGKIKNFMANFMAAPVNRGMR
jgi:hypothetical protein